MDEAGIWEAVIVNGVLMTTVVNGTPGAGRSGMDQAGIVRAVFDGVGLRTIKVA